jgi:hypothetical protein
MRKWPILLAIASALSLLTAQSALAAAVPLTGETLTGTASTSGTCPSNFGGSVTYTFSASGVASAPYAGTFTENGSFTADLNNEAVTAFDASFTINVAGGGVVTGTKTGVVSSSDGSCGFGGVAVLTTNYTATITDTTGSTCTDSGTSAVNIDGFASATAAPFTESFSSTTGIVTCTTQQNDKAAKEMNKTLAQCDKFGPDSPKCAKAVEKLQDKLSPADFATFTQMFISMFGETPPIGG